MWTSLLLPIALFATLGKAQDVLTVTDALGETVAVSFSTDDLGETVFTQLLSTISASDLGTTSPPSATSTSTTPTSATVTPTATGTALPPFGSVSPSAGTIINYSQYSVTGIPTTSAILQPGHNAASSIRPPQLGSASILLVSLLGGAGFIWALA